MGIVKNIIEERLAKEMNYHQQRADKYQVLADFHQVEAKKHKKALDDLTKNDGKSNDLIQMLKSALPPMPEIPYLLELREIFNTNKKSKFSVINLTGMVAGKYQVEHKKYIRHIQQKINSQVWAWNKREVLVRYTDKIGEILYSAGPEWEGVYEKGYIRTKEKKGL